MVPGTNKRQHVTSIVIEFGKKAVEIASVCVSGYVSNSWVSDCLRNSSVKGCDTCKKDAGAGCFSKKWNSNSIMRHASTINNSDSFDNILSEFTYIDSNNGANVDYLIPDHHDQVPDDDISDYDPILPKGEKAEDLPNSNSVYTIQVSPRLETPAVTVVTIGLADIFLLKPNFGNPISVAVTCLESSYQEFLSETKLKPFVLEGMSIQASNDIQLSQPLTFMRKTGNGVICQHPLQVFDYISINQFQNVAEVFPLKVDFDAKSGFSFKLFKRQSVQFTLYLGLRIDPSNNLKDRPVLQYNPNVRKAFEGPPKLQLR